MEGRGAMAWPEATTEEDTDTVGFTLKPESIMITSLDIVELTSGALSAAVRSHVSQVGAGARLTQRVWDPLETTWK